MKGMRFFHEVPTKEGSMDSLVKSILQSVRTEYHLNGTYEGRDRDLSRAYRQSLDKAGGLQKLVKNVSKINKTAGALLCIGNELRNDFQGYSHAEIPEEIKEDYERLKHIKKQWLELSNKESLETLLKQIKEVQEDAEGNGEGSDDDSKGDSSSSTGAGSSGNESGGEQQESPEEHDDSRGDQVGSGGEGEGSPEGTGEPDGSDPGDEGSEGESDRGDQQPVKHPGRAGGESEELGGREQQAQGSSQEVDGPPPKSPEGTPSDSFGVGAGKAISFLKDIGMIKEASNKDVRPESSDPYIPCSPVKHEDISRKSPYPSGYVRRIEETLGTFSLTKKIKKYLTVMSQTGYLYGQKQGKICSKSISRLYTSQSQPRIFKTRASSKIEEDSAVFLLGDASGSMGGSKYTVSSCCQIAISEVLQSLQIPHMMMQFTAAGYERIHLIMKRFDEHNVSRDKLIGRYGHGMISLGDNADGEAVTEAAQMLAKRPEKHKLLIVLSDGRPAFSGGRGDSGRFLKDSVAAIEASRIMSIVGIGIQSEYVKNYYKDYRVVNELDQLERVLIDLLRQNILR
jgi:hypothetical protein